MPLMTMILKPGEFNSAVLAKLYWEAMKNLQLSRNVPTPGLLETDWEMVPGWYKRDLIDLSQSVLDTLRTTGVIG